VSGEGISISRVLTGSLSFPREFGIEHNTWLTGMVNAA
jgi:hypothetical protein